MRPNFLLSLQRGILPWHDVCDFLSRSHAFVALSFQRGLGVNLSANPILKNKRLMPGKTHAIPGCRGGKKSHKHSHAFPIKIH